MNLIRTLKKISKREEVSYYYKNTSVYLGAKNEYL